jgi:hypothetical protein
MPTLYRPRIRALQGREAPGSSPLGDRADEDRLSRGIHAQDSGLAEDELLADDDDSGSVRQLNDFSDVQEVSALGDAQDRATAIRVFRVTSAPVANRYVSHLQGRRGWCRHDRYATRGARLAAPGADPSVLSSHGR